MTNLRRGQKPAPAPDRATLPPPGDGSVDRRTDDPAAGYAQPKHAKDSDLDPWATQDRDVGAWAPERDADSWSTWAGQPVAPEYPPPPEPVRSPESARMTQPLQPLQQVQPAQQAGSVQVPESTQERDRDPRAAAGSDQGAIATGPSAMAASAPAALALLGGVWLLVSRLVYDFPAAGSSPQGVANGLIVGIVITLVALARLTGTRSNPLLGLVLVAFGAWMIAAPWIFGYDRWSGASSRATWSDVITAGLVILSGLATWFAGTVRQLRTAVREGSGREREPAGAGT